MNTRFLLKFLDPGFILKTAIVLLGLSLIGLGEFFIIELISGFWGVYFTLAVAAASGLAGLFLSYREINTIIGIIREGVSEGVYSEKEMVQLAGALFGGLLLLFPGFITDVFGAISFFPVIRMLYGRIITRKVSSQLNELYEYLRLYD